MKKFLKIVCFVVPLICSTGEIIAQGREVTIYLKDGKQKSGELLSVRESLISVLKTSIEDDEEIASHPEIVEIALLQDIESVHLGEYEVSGAGIGALIGAGVGLIIDIAVIAIHKPVNPISLGTPLGALAGSLIGAGIASGMSKKEETIRPSPDNGLRDISGYARFDNFRYNNQEPGFVRDIIDNLVQEQK